MVCFLTSSTLNWDDDTLNTKNGLRDELRRVMTGKASGLFIASDPENHPKTDENAQITLRSFRDAGMDIDPFITLDSRNAHMAPQLVREADLIVLAGGHVPTQNDFFRSIGLRELMADFRGVVVGISAGTMNSAETVYAQPEEPGEAVDPNYARFLSGLGLTDIMVIPHYQMIKNDVLDGLRVFEDISYPDSVGRQFYALTDGSYLLIENGVTTLRGEAYLIKDGALSPICRDGEEIALRA